MGLIERHLGISGDYREASSDNRLLDTNREASGEQDDKAPR